MQTAELLTHLASAGASLRRLPGDQFEVIGGRITPTIATALRERKPELLTLYSEPPDPFDKLWSETLDKANAQLSPTWFGMAADWARIDDIEERFANAKADADLQAAEHTSRDYIALAEHFGALDRIHAWADAST